ncbi:glycosyltransferase [Ammoniphilus sp. CFH 90114]|uniref:glycosyltransferase n=1 Tax=Ammoniphilus sp. CFH 90114 TaxID=2493665 RepID=UPI00100DC8E6|nr:glycosyltransferase [Ammoniphilus sp. CFH 90114]RXT09076.1 glycosyltransferase [Ammoniphilus sp. CFH 90114]
MHILFFTPYFNQPRGNATTSKRVIHYLQKQGIQTCVFPYDEADLWHLPHTVDIVHILHATRFAAWAREHKFTLSKPYILTMGGTDINSDLQSEVSNDVFQLLDRADALTVFTEDALEKVKALNQDWFTKTHVIPQAAWISWKVKKRVDYHSPHILLPAGLRPVKDVLHALPALDILAQEYMNPSLKYTILGANLDQEVHKQVMMAAESRPWMDYAGVVPFEVMTQWYNDSNIVINTSITEGQSLAVMEAMAMGRPVIARRNPANESLIQHGITGWLYETPNEFVQAVHSIMKEPSLRNNVTRKAQQWIEQYSSPKKEAEAYIRLYRKATESVTVCR